MQEINVKNVIIGKQFENSENYETFRKIVKEKKVKVKIVEAGDKINVEENLYFDVLWPNSNHVVKENVLNNNSLICKLVYKNFSMMFVGDIEEIAEKELIKLYLNKDILEVNVLKIAHHGSKTSSSMEFLNAVKPEIVLIGVGKDNSFGHPNEDVIARLKDLRYKNL